MDWTPAPRRSSAMRREQNLALVGAVVSGAVIATGLLLLLVARVNPDAGARMRGAMLDIVSPTWSIVRLPFDGGARAFGWAGDYLGAVDRNRQLTADLATANARLQKAAADQLALKQLQKLMSVRVPGRTPVVTTRIVAATSGSVVRTAMLSAGTGDGVGVGMPVIAADGLIGRTIETGRHASAGAAADRSRQPRSRSSCSAPARPGWSSAATAPALTLRDRVGAEEPLRTGDRLVTSGDGGVFPPGIPGRQHYRRRGRAAAGAPGDHPARHRLSSSSRRPWLPLPAEPVVAESPPCRCRSKPNASRPKPKVAKPAALP